VIYIPSYDTNICCSTNLYGFGISRIESWQRDLFSLPFRIGLILFLFHHMIPTFAVAQIYMALKFSRSNPGSEK